MKKLLFLAYLFISSQSFALDLAKYPIELTSQEGYSVVIAPTKDQKQALVKVTGINHDIDGITFLMDLKPQGSNKAYKFTYDGTERSLISIDKGYRCCSYTLYIPDTRDGIYLAKKEGANPAIVEDLKAQYQQHIKKGTQAKLARFNRQKHLNYQQSKIDTANDSVVNQCGLSIKTTIKWDSIDDTVLQSYAVGSFCAQVADEMVDMCKKDINFKNDIAHLNTINCQFSDKLKLRQSSGVLTFKTSPKAPNQSQFIEAYLLNL
ncbi:hypothetical protein [Pseudoalteromonas sp. 10-33]|uniref:hypothetical protein n=1 Tax=Pseudoalteromonas sp. 10-33 TaxID=1761890 RepID=UPI00073204FE|nr:hypothetical protein [Pseudoalteromonas sp. 10-33]KTF17093.1 hypothetical protein ATS76_16725 [Pseudoalteromonas sp. 10-33]